MRIVYGIAVWLLFNQCAHAALWEDRVDVAPWRECLFALCCFGSLGVTLWRLAAAEMDSGERTRPPE